MSVLPFRNAEDRKADQMIDQLCAIVDGQPTLTGINACLHTLALLLSGYGHEHGDTSAITVRCCEMLHVLVGQAESDWATAEVALASDDRA